MKQANFQILVVEDEALLLEAIGKKLQREKIDAILCKSGAQALEHLNKRQRLPDAIWLDYYLKDMDGLTFMNKIKENPRLKNLPVIVVSNSASSKKVSSMLALGATKYLLKAQYRLEEIVDMIRDFISKDKGEISPPA